MFFGGIIVTSKQSNTCAHKKQAKRDERKRGEEKAKVLENHFRSSGEENKRRMANNVMRGGRVYDGYLVCLDLGHRSPQQRRQKSFLVPLEAMLVFPQIGRDDAAQRQ